jgi:hypothetical protein
MVEFNRKAFTMKTNVHLTRSLRGLTTMSLGALLFTTGVAVAGDEPAWDKTFPKSYKVEHQKVTFKNRYGITLVGDLYCSP